MSARERHLANAPIREALIDIQADTPSGFDVTAATPSLHAQLGTTYSPPEVRKLFQGQISHNDNRLTTEAKDTGVHALFFRSNDSFNLVQARRNGFTFNRTRPYQNWDALVSEAHRTWGIYCRTFQVSRVRRVGIRFINAIEADQTPSGVVDIEKYLEPKISVSQPSAEVLETMSRHVYRYSSLHATAILVLGTGLLRGETVTSVIVDIDVHRDFEESPSEQELWEVIGSFRALKNQLFFSSITERVATLCE